MIIIPVFNEIQCLYVRVWYTKTNFISEHSDLITKFAGSYSKIAVSKRFEIHED